MERKIEGHNQANKSLFHAIRELAAPPVKLRREIGFHAKEVRALYRVEKKQKPSDDRMNRIDGIGKSQRPTPFFILVIL